MAPKRTTRSTRVPPVTPTPNEPTTTVTEAQLQALIDQGVAAAMAEAEASRVRNGLAKQWFWTKASTSCTEGVVRLTRWFEKMESVFSISNCTASCQVKFATCNLQDDALTWWNTHVKTTTPEAAHAMPWATLKKMMTDKYCLRGEIKKIKTEMWNLKVKGTDVVAYSRRFQQLALMCSRMFPEEIHKIEKYIGGLPDMIHGSVKASKPKTMQEAIELTTELMDEKTHAYAERQAERKRKNCLKLRNNDRGNQAGNDTAPAKVYVVGNAGANPDNIVTVHPILHYPKGSEDFNRIQRHFKERSKRVEQSQRRCVEVEGLRIAIFVLSLLEANVVADAIEQKERGPPLNSSSLGYDY
ncbi:reverse transcriptase domain-containing protein [Tanacetum coccineum]